MEFGVVFSHLLGLTELKLVSLPFRGPGQLSHSSLLVGLLEHGVFIISCRLLMSLVKDDKFIKLFTILKGRRTIKEGEVLPQGSKLRGDEFWLKYSKLSTQVS